MNRIAHRSASRGWGLLLTVASAATLAALPATARAQVVEAGHAAVAGTLAGGVSAGCATFHEEATALGAVDDPVGTYSGSFDITADGSSSICPGSSNLVIDSGYFTVSVSGTNGGSSIVCRQYGTPIGSGAPMTGIWFRIGPTLILGADGVCTINGVDSVHEQVWQTLVLVPDGPPSSLTPVEYGDGVVSGDLRIGN